MKPLGMDASFRVKMPAPWEDALWSAVQDAQAAGVSALHFKREMAEAWAQSLRDQAKADERVLLA